MNDDVDAGVRSDNTVLLAWLNARDAIETLAPDKRKRLVAALITHYIDNEGAINE